MNVILHFHLFLDAEEDNVAVEMIETVERRMYSVISPFICT